MKAHNFDKKFDAGANISKHLNVVKVNTKKLRAALYARVSTSDKGQDPALQLTPLSDYCKQRGWLIAGRYVDHCTGKTARRPELDKLLDAARKRQIDCIVVWKLDRFGRSMQHLVNTLVELQDLGISFVSYMESLDFTSASGKLMFNILASFAQFERDIISDRVRAGIQNAKAKGVRIGRKPITPGEQERIFKLTKDGLSIRAIAKELGLAVGTVHKNLTSKAKSGKRLAVLGGTEKRLRPIPRRRSEGK